MNLKTYLRTSKIRVTEFAALVDVTPSMVSQWLSGHRPIAPKRALKIHEVTGGKVSKHDLCPEVFPREPKKQGNVGGRESMAAPG